MPRLLTAFQKKAQEEKEKLEKAAAMIAKKGKAAENKKAKKGAAAPDNQAAIDDQLPKDNAVTVLASADLLEHNQGGRMKKGSRKQEKLQRTKKIGNNR